MAVAAFKSSSRRGNQKNQSSTPSSTSSSSTSRSSRELSRNKAPIRRSKSVSTFSRGNLDISSEFLNKRDNPLFCSTTAPPRDDKTQSSSNSLLLETSVPDCDSLGASGARGRHVTRNGEAKGSSTTGRKETGRSLSRVDTGRRTRSASQCPTSRRRWNCSTSESETEGKDRNDMKFVGSKRCGLFGSDNCVVDQARDQRRWSTRHSSTEVSDCFAATLSSLETQRCEDAVSTASSGYGSDVKTIKAVCEQMKPGQEDLLEVSNIYETLRSEVSRAISEIQNDLESAIQRSNATAIAVTTMADIPAGFVNPDAEELVLEIRREYARMLEESQERARNLRANLAVEEHCGQELDRILKEVLPYPKTPNGQKPHPARKTSIERRRMSKRLAEDAKAYFDDSVSLSTFDSSDFSSQEDPPLTSIGPATPSGSYDCLLEESDTQAQSMRINYDISQPVTNIETAGAVHGHLNSITGRTENGCKSCFSLSQKPLEISGFQRDIQQYIKKFGKNGLKSSNMRSSYVDIREYSHQSPAEDLLIDRVLLKNRIESGGLLLCGGGNKLSSESCGIGI